MTLATEPVFVVVGHVNKGKSSLVATLAEDERIAIERIPGTTRHANEYAYRLQGRTLFRLIDTPGFQDARHALRWMRERVEGVAGRPKAVHAFVEAHRGGERFQDEVRLLDPVLAGAGILYVVDASRPFREGDDAEMEILRWTGQPGMALVNHIRDDDYRDEWIPVLQQFFNLVRTFNAHRATFRERIELLSGFREIRAEWRARMDEAIRAMEVDWGARRERTAAILADFLVDALTHIEKREVSSGDPETHRQELEATFRERLRDQERKARREVEEVHHYAKLESADDAVDLEHADLFSERSFVTFGLTTGQLTKYAAAWGAAIGGAIDLMVGGLSFLLGTVIGAAAGALSAYVLGDQVARTWGSKSKLAKTLFPGETGEYLYMGPVTNARFAWILFDRALVHAGAVRLRTHARRDALQVAPTDESQSIARTLEASLRDPVDSAFRKLLTRSTRGESLRDARAALTHAIDDVLRSRES